MRLDRSDWYVDHARAVPRRLRGSLPVEAVYNHQQNTKSFFELFCEHACTARVVVHDLGLHTDLFELFSSAVATDKDLVLEIHRNLAIETFSMHAFLLPKEFSDDEKGHNAIYYGAHNRTVKRYEIDQAIGLQRINGKHVFYGFIESDFFNSIVNQERTRFSWPLGLFEEPIEKQSRSPESSLARL
jgi:hypothetical protein